MASNKSNLRNQIMLEAFQKEGVKVHVEFIDPNTDLRPKYIYEALADTGNEEECSVTVYVYVGTSSQVLYSIERKTKWNSQWDEDAKTIATGLGYSLEV